LFHCPSATATADTTNMTATIVNAVVAVCKSYLQLASKHPSYGQSMSMSSRTDSHSRNWPVQWQNTFMLLLPTWGDEVEHTRTSRYIGVGDTKTPMTAQGRSTPSSADHAGTHTRGTVPSHTAHTNGIHKVDDVRTLLPSGRKPCDNKHKVEFGVCPGCLSCLCRQRVACGDAAHGSVWSKHRSITSNGFILWRF
jgi:hypothetical protein